MEHHWYEDVNWYFVFWMGVFGLVSLWSDYKPRLVNWLRRFLRIDEP